MFGLFEKFTLFFIKKIENDFTWYSLIFFKVLLQSLHKMEKNTFIDLKIKSALNLAWIAKNPQNDHEQ